MKNKRRRIHLLKKDIFWFKPLIFRLKMHFYIKKSIKFYSKCIYTYQRWLYKLGIPNTDEKLDLVNRILKHYDNCVEKLEKLIEYDRKYVENYSKQKK